MKSMFGRYEASGTFAYPNPSCGLRGQAWITQPQKHKRVYQAVAEDNSIQPNPNTEEVIPVNGDNDTGIQSNAVETVGAAYGYVYQQGAQTLSVRRPGETIPVRFSSNACMRHVIHKPDTSDITVMDAGDYEISFDLNLRAKAASFAAFELQVNGAVLPGGRFCRMLTVGSQVCHALVIAALGANDTVRLVMTSATACEAALACGGVSAAIRIHRLGESTEVNL